MKELIDQIKDKQLRDLTVILIERYLKHILEMPSSLTRRYHPTGENEENHLKRTFYFAKHIIREFNLSEEESDILLAASLLHDIGYYEFIDTKRDPEQYQKLYPAGWNRSKEAYKYHPAIGMFIVGQEMLKKHIINPKIIRTALIISSHMDHWLGDYNPMPEDDLAVYLALADYFASRKDIIIKDLESCKNKW